MVVVMVPGGTTTVDFSEHMKVLVENGLSDGDTFALVTKGFWGTVCFLTSIDDKLVITKMFNPKKIKNELQEATIIKNVEIASAKITFTGKLILTMLTGEKQKYGEPSMYDNTVKRKYYILQKLNIPIK